MIVVRYTFPVKPGAEEKAVAWIKSLTDYGIPRPPLGERVYWYHFAPWCEVIHEMQFENLAEYEVFESEMAAVPRLGEAVGKVGEFLLPGGRSEVWNVEAIG
jgi:hypothetical protein